jgi:hypothetical protein
VICVIRVIRVLLMRSLLRPPIAEPYTQLITDPKNGSKGREVSADLFQSSLQDRQVQLFQGVTDAYLADSDFALIGDDPLQYFERRVGANFDGRSKRFELFYIEW